MQITINGKSEEMQATTILDVLRAKNIDPQMVAVELNDALVEPNNVLTVIVKEGDKLEFLFYMGGGSSAPLVPKCCDLFTVVG